MALLHNEQQPRHCYCFGAGHPRKAKLGHDAGAGPIKGMGFVSKPIPNSRCSGVEQGEADCVGTYGQSVWHYMANPGATNGLFGSLALRIGLCLAPSSEQVSCDFGSSDAFAFSDYSSPCFSAEIVSVGFCEPPETNAVIT